VRRKDSDVLARTLGSLIDGAAFRSARRIYCFQSLDL
jgi:hypothetical protein